MRYIQAFLLILFLGAVLIFALQNLNNIEVAFLGWSINAPVAAVVVLVYVLGMLTGWAVLAFIRRTLHDVRARGR